MNDYSKMPCVPPENPKPKVKEVNPRDIRNRYTISEYKPQNTHRVSIFEQQKPFQKTRVTDPNSHTIGERPPVNFGILSEYRDRTPQIDSIIEYLVDLVVGTDININAEDETAKELLEKFSTDIDLYSKVRSLADTAFEGGTALFYQLLRNGELENIEQLDMIGVKSVVRDQFGNLLDVKVDDGNGFETSIKKLGLNIKQIIPLIFRPRGRDFFGRSVYHGLAVERNVGNRTTRPIIEALWSLDDVVIGTLENFAYPVEYHIFDGINETDLELEAQKIKEAKPGDRFFLSRMHEIDRREPTQARFDAFFEHTSNLVQLGTGFPLEILLGDFTSRASSQTTDSLLMRRVKAFQQHLVKVIKEAILIPYLKNVKGSRWVNDESITKLAITVEFETRTPMEYTPDQVLSRFTSGAWTVKELRQYDKANGQDLFDDDEVEQNQELQKEDGDEDSDSLREMAKIANSLLLKDIQKGNIKDNEYLLQEKLEEQKQLVESSKKEYNEKIANEIINFIKKVND